MDVAYSETNMGFADVLLQIHKSPRCIPTILSSVKDC